MSQVTVHTKDYCPYCTAAKNLLTQRGIPYSEIKYGAEDFDKLQALIQKSGMRTVPQIFHGDTLIGGFDSLSELDKKDQLASLKA
jgi:glutaredoxin 3